MSFDEVGQMTDGRTSGDLEDVHLQPFALDASIVAGMVGLDFDPSEPPMSGYPEVGEQELPSPNVGNVDTDVLATQIDEQEREVNIDHRSTQETFRQSLPSNIVQHFWESDPFLSSVFGSGNVVDDLFPRVNLKRPHTAIVVPVDDDELDERPVVKALYKGSKRPVYMSAIKHSAIEIDENKRRAALSGWTTLVLINVNAFTAFDDALDHSFRTSATHWRDSEVRAVTQRTLAECFARKATSTLLKRLGSIRRYVTFCQVIGADPFPVEEQTMYDFMQSLKDEVGVGASTGRSFLEAVRFSGAMLGMKTSGNCLISQRLAGLGEVLAKRAQATLQAAPLTVKQIVALERLCCGGESLHDRVISGGVLMMVFGCARASDMARAVKLTVDRVNEDVVVADREPDTSRLAYLGRRHALHNTKGCCFL